MVFTVFQQGLKSQFDDSIDILLDWYGTDTLGHMSTMKTKRILTVIELYGPVPSP